MEDILLPVIFSIGPLTLHTLSVFVFLAFFLGMFFVWKRGKELRLDEENLLGIVFVMLLYMFIGSRVFYVLINMNEFGLDIFRWINIIGSPGFYFFGAIIGLGFGVWHQASINKIDFFTLIDVLVPGMSLALALLALGAFFNGTGFGIPTNFPWGVTFPGLYDSRHPVQLYEFAMYTGLFAFLWWVEGVYRTFSWYKGSRSEAYTGFVGSLFLIIHGLIEIFAGLLTPALVTWLGLRIDIGFGFLWMVFGSLLLIYRSGIKTDHFSGKDSMELMLRSFGRSKK